MATDHKRSGINLPAGVLQPTTPPDDVDTGDGSDLPSETKAPKSARKKKTAPAEKVEDMKLYLSEDVRFRLRMLAFKRGTKLSTVANEVLDKALPRWKLEREV